MGRMASAAEADRGLPCILKTVSPRRFFSLTAYIMRNEARVSRRSATLPFVPIAVAVYAVAKATPADPEETAAAPISMTESCPPGPH